MEWSWNIEGRPSCYKDFMYWFYVLNYKAWKEAWIFILNLYLEINLVFVFCSLYIMQNQYLWRKSPECLMKSRHLTRIFRYTLWRLVIHLTMTNRVCRSSAYIILYIYLLAYIFQGKSSDRVTAESGSDIDDPSSPFRQKNSTFPCSTPVDEEVSCGASSLFFIRLLSCQTRVGECACQFTCISACISACSCEGGACTSLSFVLYMNCDFCRRGHRIQVSTTVVMIILLWLRKLCLEGIILRTNHLKSTIWGTFPMKWHQTWKVFVHAFLLQISFSCSFQIQ